MQGKTLPEIYHDLRLDFKGDERYGMTSTKTKGN